MLFKQMRNSILSWIFSMEGSYSGTSGRKLSSQRRGPDFIRHKLYALLNVFTLMELSIGKNDTISYNNYN